jgi:hypothetical protein
VLRPYFNLRDLAGGLSSSDSGDRSAVIEKKSPLEGNSRMQRKKPTDDGRWAWHTGRIPSFDSDLQNRPQFDQGVLGAIRILAQAGPFAALAL